MEIKVFGWCSGYHSCLKLILMFQCTSFEISVNDQMRCVKLLLFKCGPSRRQVSELAIILLLNGFSAMSPILRF